MEKTPVFEGEAQEEKKNYENQPVEESHEGGEIASEEGENPAPVLKVETVSEVPTETAADKEAKTEPNGVTQDSGYTSFSADSTTELKTATEEKKEEENTSETNPLEMEPERLRKLFVGGLPHGAKIEDIEKALGEFYVRFGEVEKIFVAYEKPLGVSQGYGFVTFTTRAAVDAVISSRPHTVAGQQVCEKRATPKGRNGTIDTNALFVTGITEGVDETALSAHFSKYGTVDSVKIHNDPVTQKPRGFAFVNFADSDSADQCVLDSRWHVINGIQVTAEKAIPKNAQNQRDRNFRAQRSRGPADRRNSGSGGWGMGTMPPPLFYPPPFGGQYPPMVRENQNLAYRAAAGADRSEFNYPPPPMRAFLADMAATAAMGQAFHANQRPPTQQRRSGGGQGDPMGRWNDNYY